MNIARSNTMGDVEGREKLMDLHLGEEMEILIFYLSIYVFLI
jgi:hypothetical protein